MVPDDGQEWSLTYKMNWTKRSPSKDVQLKLLEPYLEGMKKKIEKAHKLWDNFPYGVAPIAEISKICKKNKTSFIDVDFLPVDDSISNPKLGQSFDTVIQWRRPCDFMTLKKGEKIQVFDKSIEPSDIKQGQLGDCWFMCSISSLAERPALVRNLFITQQYNDEGVYRLRLFKNGEWVEVTIDDYIPCIPGGQPIFSKAHGDELWVLLLEKAYAKLHGNYKLLSGGFANEGMQDLTGAPTISFIFEEDSVKQMFDNGSLWKLLSHYDSEGYIMSASTSGEDRWTESGGGPT